MRIPRTKTLIWAGLLIGLLAGFALGATVITDVPDDERIPVDNGVPFSSPNNNTVTLYESTNVSDRGPWSSSDTLDFWTDDGNITVQSGGDTHIALKASEITGSQTIVREIDANGQYIVVNPEDKHKLGISGSAKVVNYSSYNIDDGNQDLWYKGPDSSTVKIRYYNLPADTQIEARDTNTGNLLDVNTTDANGETTFLLPASSHGVQLQTASGNNPPELSNEVPSDGATIRYDNETLEIDVSDDEMSSGGDVDVTIDLDGNQVHSETISSNQTVSTQVTGLSEGDHTWTVEATDDYGDTTTETYSFTVDHHDPQVTNLQPAGKLDYNPSDLSADINDTDFNKDGDSLTVTFYLDGQQIDQQTVLSNQTVTTSIPQSGLTGGQHTFAVNATDDYGQSTNVTQTYSVPNTLYVRHELNHSDLVDSGVTLNITFFGPDTTYSRSTSDGTLNMTGLPVNDNFIAVATPSDNAYTTRALWVPNIYEQQSIYLLNTSKVSTIESRFVLNDPTGQYDSSSVVAIQRPINTSNTTEWQTIHSDEFGVEGVTVTLEEGQRYRVKVIAQDGSQQIVGPYRADVGEEVTVQPGSPEIDIPEFTDGYGYNAGIENQTVEYRYDDPENKTDKLVVWIHEKNNESNQLIQNDTYYDLGSAYRSISINANESEKTWVVKFVITRDGEQIIQKKEIANQKTLFDPLAPGLQASLGILMLILLGGAFSVLNAGIGAVVVSLAAGILWWVGLLSGVASGMLIAIAIFISVIYYVAVQSGP